MVSLSPCSNQTASFINLEPQKQKPEKSNQTTPHQTQELKSTKKKGKKEKRRKKKERKKEISMMALFLDEDEVWKCSKHPSKRRRSGICPICLRERLLALCPECANVRPCSCCATSSSSSSSSSSSFSRFSFSVAGTGSGVGTVGRVHSLIDSEPALCRSRSMAIPFFRSRSRFSGGDRDFDPDSTDESPALNRSKSTRSFWSMFKPQKSNRSGAQENRDSRKVLVGGEDAVGDASRTTITATTAMLRSRSVAASGAGGRELKPPAKGRGWFFPSPIKAFRQSKAPSKINQERSPLYRG